MPDFRIVLHARGAHIGQGDTLTIGGDQVHTLTVTPTDLAHPFSISFEVACQRLNALHRMFLELDGSFVWTGQSDGARWQVEGSVLDRTERLLFVERWGSCPPVAFDQLLTALGWPETAVIVQLVEHAIYVEVPEFCRLQRWPSCA